MNYFMFLETKFVERQKALNVTPQEVTPENQAKFNAVMANIQLGRRTVQYAYQAYLLLYFICIKVRIVKGPEFKSSIPEQPKKEVKLPTLEVVPNNNDLPPAA